MRGQMRTFNALMARGFDSEAAHRLTQAGYTLNSLKQLNAKQLLDLNIPSELIKILLQEPRPPIPSETLNKVLYESRMTCCVCRDRSQGIIVHHIQEYSSSRSHAEDNLVVLCLNHHGEAHTKRELQLNLTPERLHEFKKRWLKDVKQYDHREAQRANIGYSYQAIKQISDSVHHSIHLQGNLNTPKFNLKVEELPDGRNYLMLLKENTNKIIWQLIQFPLDVGGYPIQCISNDDQLIISNFGGSCLLFYRLKDKKFSLLSLDSYEAGNLALLAEKKKYGKSPVIRKYPPGEIIIVGDKLFVAQIFSEFVLVIDLCSKEIIKRIPVGGEGQLAYSTQNNQVYFASNTLGVFFIIDPNSYQFEAIQYPDSNLNIGSLFSHPESGLLYLGLHRTSQKDTSRLYNEEPLIEANSFIAIYNSFKRKYISQIELAIDDNDRLERCWASSMIYEKSHKLLYIGMLGSPKNIYIIDTNKNKVINFIQLQANRKNKHDYVDSLSLAFYKTYLLSVNRSNYELSVIDQNTMQQLISIPLNGTGNGPRYICVYNDVAYISHWEYDGLIAVNLQEVIDLFLT